ncbi:conserved membrane hypothetical protein [Candidatus Methylobacter favarea]|uniref:Uncharacterized protein n=1 Tax=Candidatus Methylobacter favarea TaxID=2707345 RepID=A0A8S0X3G6_9GAMM|nr:UPF0182 family protein [Candidatus Methylobacter favarea]CAA9892724.1 conserved membrane hypothetical protein [Candidatus Methylobacter favarea]
MGNWKFLPALIGSVLVVGIVLYVAFYFIFLHFFVDLWWFESLKLEFYFWLRLLYKFFLFGGVTLAFFTIFFLHFWIASRYLGLNPPDDVLGNLEKNRRFQHLADQFMSGSVKIYTPISLILAMVVAIPFYKQWETALLYFYGRDSGLTEPVYGNDISFYLLSYPIYMLIQQELLSTAILIFLLVGILYWLEHNFVPNQRKQYPLGAKIHLIVLIVFVLIYVVWGFLLQRFSLLYTDTHEPVFYGPGFVEIRYQLPLIWLGIITFLATAITASIFVFSDQHRIKAPFIISLLAFIGVLLLPKSQFIPDLIQKYIVAPNPVKAEKPFMDNNIKATLDAYDLKNIKTIDLTIKLNATQDIETWGNQKRFENIPVWDREYLIDSYKQLQEIRPYYRFLAVDEDRYFILDHTRQVNLAAREVNISKLPEAAQNWENTHLRYTHGYGAVVTPAAQDADKPLVWYLRDLNMYSDVGLNVKHPDIYFGQEQYDYAIVPNKLNIVGIAGTASMEGEEYKGEGGIPISSYFRKALLSFYFQDPKIFFSVNISTRSQLLMRRNITERITRIAPFLHLDKDPYLVLSNDRFYWIQDAYTLSPWYPVSKSAADDFLEGNQKFNYIRNSVKIIVDALDGDVDFYISDPSDAIIQAYRRIYPGLFKNLEEMPAELRKHLRYPRDLYYLQMKVYARYHQRTPELFYEQAETWQFANVRRQPVRPYYQTMDFGNCNNREEFVMINPMTPVNRDNLSMIGVAGIVDGANCGLDYKPGITVYRFGKEVQVNGPAQVEALINQNPEISAQFTLWGRYGSTVKMGRMIILPMGNTILYVQPIYLVSIKTKIPELTRVIVSIGNEVVMDRTLWSAFERLKKIYIQGAAQTEGAETLKAIEKPEGE